VSSDDFLSRLKSLFLPVAALSIGLLGCYSLIHWLVLAGVGLEPLDDHVIDTWLPLTLAAFLEFALVAPRLQILALPRHTLRFLVNAIAFAVIAAPVCLAQGEIRVLSGNLTHVQDAGEIAAAPASRYYSARTICVDREQLGFKIVAQPNDNRTRLNLNAFVVLPVCGPGKSAGLPSTWIGLTFQDSIDNLSNPQSRKDARDAFVAEIDHRIAAEYPIRTSYLERSNRSDERRNFDLALESRGIDAPERQIILIPHFEPFGQPTGNGWKGIALSLALGALIWLALIMLVPLDRQRVETAKNGGVPHANPAMTILIPSASSYGLQALICLNLIVFLAMMISGLGFWHFPAEALVSWGGNYGPELEGLGLSRLITCQFVHSGIMHLVCNMYGLIVVGLFLAPVIGNRQMIGCYLVCGLGGGIAGALAHPRIVSVGASGAILGLWGITLALALLRDARVAAIRPALMTNLAIFSAFTLVMGSLSEGIDNAGHMGGFLTGAVMGAAIHLLERRQTRPDGVRV
jgi:membrane associated rhomboid family serine protease